MRALPIGLILLGLMGIPTVGITSPASPVNKVIIGVLDLETVGGSSITSSPLEQKKALMNELKRNTRVILVDIRESCGLSDLKKHGYERANRYKNIYQLDMILHTFGGDGLHAKWTFIFSLIDFYTKKVKEVSIDTMGREFGLMFRGISQKLLASGDLNRVLREKKKVLAKKEVALPKEVVERPKEIEDLIQNGPKLIAGGGYNRVLELIDDLPGRRRRHIQIQIIECFANLKGWVWNRDESCKLSWWSLRQRLIISGDNEATPLLVIFLGDEDPWMRLYAAELLGHMGDERALKDLRDVATNDENHKVRRYAKKAYKQIAGEEF